MITLLVIGTIALVFELVKVALKMTWGLFQALVCVLGLPFIIIGLFIAGLTYVSLPVLIIAIIIAFIVSRSKKEAQN